MSASVSIHTPSSSNRASNCGTVTGTDNCGITLDHLLKFPEVLETDGLDQDDEEEWALARQALGRGAQAQHLFRLGLRLRSRDELLGLQDGSQQGIEMTQGVSLTAGVVYEQDGEEQALVFEFVSSLLMSPQAVAIKNAGKMVGDREVTGLLFEELLEDAGSDLQREFLQRAVASARATWS